MSIAQTPFFIPIQLGKEAHDCARKFAKEQATPEKYKRVYLNTLAVCAVSSYLQWMEIKTAPTQGDCWQSTIRRFQDVADLVLPNLGRLECRPVLPGETVISLPPAAREDRIGYVAVEFEEEWDRVKLLGFAPLLDAENPPGTIAIADLQPLEDWVEEWEALEAKAAIASFKSFKQQQKQIALSQWLEGIFDKIWQTLPEVLGEPRTQQLLGARSAAAQGVVRAAPIEWTGQSPADSLALVVAVKPKADLERDIFLQVHPTESKTLPANLTLAALEDGKVVAQNQSAKDREWVQLKVNGKQGEQFAVNLQLGEASATWNFVI